VLVEGALVMLPLMALITGFIDVNLAVFQWSVMQNAVREGARYAVTYQTSAGLGQDASIEQVVSHFSMGLLPVGSPFIRVNYYSQKALATPIPAPAGNAPGNIVEVSVQNYPLNWLIPIAGTIAAPFRSQAPGTLNIYSDDVMGGYPVGVNSVAR
jgi:hypothetical protein